MKKTTISLVILCFITITFGIGLVNATNIITNSTTSGWTSNNITLNGSRYSGEGKLALNIRNDSSFNTSGIVTYMSLDETTGKYYRDTNPDTGNIDSSIVGTWDGHTSINTSTIKSGNSAYFDGINDYVSLGRPSQLNLTGAISISAWVNATNWVGTYLNPRIVSKSGDETNRGWELIIEGGSDQVCMRVSYDGINSHVTCTNAVKNQTVQYVGTYEPGVAVRLYENGILKSSLTSGISASMNNSITPVYIGARYDCTNCYFKGSIDEVMIWNRALSEAEVAVLYNTSFRDNTTIIISNQSNTYGNKINRTRIIYSGQDSTTNASLWARNNGITTWTSVQANASNYTWYTLPVAVQLSNLDFGVQLNSYGNTTPFFWNLEWDVVDTPVIISPINNSRQYNNTINVTWTLNSSKFNFQMFNSSTLTSANMVSELNSSNNYSGSIAVSDGITYYIRVRSNDTVDGLGEFSDIIQFTENSLPSISDNDFLRPPSPTATTNLTISLNITTDSEGDTIVNHTEWYKNDILNTSWNDSLFLNYSNFTGGDSIYVKAYLSDGYENTSLYTSNEVIISSSNSAPSISTITLNPTTRKYNKQVWINSSSITDSESSYVRLLTYYKVADTNVYLNNSTWYAPPTTINLTFNNPWSDGATHYIYGMVEDSGNLTGFFNLTSGEVQTSLTSDITAPSVSTSSLSATSIYIGSHVTISLNTSIANGVVSNVSVHVSRPDATSANYIMNTTDNTTWTFKYTTTSDIGSYFIESFSMQDDSGNRGTETSTLTFVASQSPTSSGGGGGGGGGSSSTIVIVKSDNGTLTLVNVTSAENLKDLLKLGECFSSNLLFSNTCARSAISIVDEPLNWWTWFGSYIGSLTVLFIIALRSDKKKKFAANVLLYGTVAWVMVVMLSFMGLNLYIWNYIFNSPLPGFMFLSFFMWGGIATVVGDSYSKRKR